MEVKQRCQVSVLFTWTLGNVKVCFVWPQVRTISFLTLAWFTWLPLTLPLSVSALNQRPLCVCLANAKSISQSLSSSILLHSLSPAVLFQRVSVNRAFAEAVFLFAQTTPRSQAQIWFYKRACLGLVDIISTRQSFFSQSHSLWALHLHLDQYFPNPELLGWPRVISWLPMLPAGEVRGQMAVWIWSCDQITLLGGAFRYSL